MEIIQLSAQTAHVNLEESGAAVLDLNLPCAFVPIVSTYSYKYRQTRKLLHKCPNESTHA